MNAKTKVLLSCGIICGPVFIITFLIEGAMRANYDPCKHPISSLSIGYSGWIQATNFIVTGSLLLAFAFALRSIFRTSKGSAAVPWLLGFVAIGLIGAGIFTTDPVYGYPVNLPLAIAQYTYHGHLHDLFSILVFLCLPSACMVLRKRFRSEQKTAWANYSLLTFIVMLATFVLAGIGFKQVAGFVNFAGIFQRLSIISGFAWITSIASYFLKNNSQ